MKFIGLLTNSSFIGHLELIPLLGGWSLFYTRRQIYVGECANLVALPLSQVRNAESARVSMPGQLKSRRGGECGTRHVEREADEKKRKEEEQEETQVRRDSRLGHQDRL